MKSKLIQNLQAKCHKIAAEFMKINTKPPGKMP
jgi:hypothetical protein